MEVKAYRCEKDDSGVKPKLDNDGIIELKNIVASKDKIVENLKGTTSEVVVVNDPEVKAIVSVSENGLKINYNGEYDYQDFVEHATIYVFDSGEVYYVFNGFANWNLGHHLSNLKESTMLDSRFGTPYELADENKGLALFAKHTKTRNEKISQLCKFKVDSLISYLQRELEKEEHKTVEEPTSGLGIK